MTVDRLLVAIGSRPAHPAVTRAALLRMGRGLYFAGDTAGGEFRQAAIAYGDGVRCAMMACQHLKEGER
jgi:thioredoxin reductase